MAIGIWMLYLERQAFDQPQFRLFLNNPMYVQALGVVAIILFGLLAIFLIKKLFDKKPGLVFTSSGIVDNASAVAAGFIPWSEVIGADIFEMQQQKMLIIKV